MLHDAWRPLRRVLAIRLDGIGDVLMTGPALRAVKRALPSAHLTLSASPAGAQAAPLMPWIDDVLVHRAPWQEAGDGPAAPDVRGRQAFVARLARGGYDAALVFTSFTQSPYPAAFTAYLAGIPLRAGQSKERGGRILTHLVEPAPDSTHETARNSHLVEALGMPVEDGRLEIAVPPRAAEEARGRLEGAGVSGPFVVVAPGAGCEARRYPFPRMARALRSLSEGTSYPLVIVDRRQRAAEAAELADIVGERCVSLAGTLSLPALAEVIRRASLLLGHDSAPMHLADAVGTPMVILYSGTERRHLFAPRSAPSWLLGRVTSCTPCHLSDCPEGHACLDLEPELIAHSALTMLRREAAVADRNTLEVVNA